MDRRLYWIWLQRRLPLGSIVINRLFEHFEDIEDIFGADERRLLPIGLRPPERERLLDQSLDEAKRILADVLKLGGWILTPDDTHYPDLLRQIIGFPAVLYGQGNFPDLNTIPTLAVVGTRHTTENGIKNTFCLSAGLAAAGMVIVSGGASGGDTAAHEGTLAVGGKTILVKAAPMNVSYPPQNEDLRRRILQQGGAIVSEYPPGLKFFCDYHVRNRLMSGMSLGVCVTEAPTRSGAVISANLARDQGRDVFALPGSVSDHHYDGAHQQIRKGATLVTSAADILEEYTARYPGLLDVAAAMDAQKRFRHTPLHDLTHPRRSSLSRPDDQPQLRVADNTSAETDLRMHAASEEARRLYAQMTNEPCPIDLLAKRAQMTIPETLVLLTELEMLGCVRSTAGQQYFRS